MKLILTSAGISNNSIKNVLKKLVGKNMKIAFIPTAANEEGGYNEWLENDVNNCKRLGEVRSLIFPLWRVMSGLNN